MFILFQVPFFDYNNPDMEWIYEVRVFASVNRKKNTHGGNEDIVSKFWH